MEDHLYIMRIVGECLAAARRAPDCDGGLLAALAARYDSLSGRQLTTAGLQLIRAGIGRLAKDAEKRQTRLEEAENAENRA